MDGDLDALFRGGTIQSRLPKACKAGSEENSKLAQKFANLMFHGKTHAALDLLTNRGQLENLNDQVHQGSPHE